MVTLSESHIKTSNYLMLSSTVVVSIPVATCPFTRPTLEIAIIIYCQLRGRSQFFKNVLLFPLALILLF